MQRTFRIVAIGTLVCLICAALPAEAQYRYGKYRYASADQGFFLFADVALTNPRNADTVVATFEQTGVISGQGLMYPIVPPWSDDPAGRLGAGYSWASGNKVVVTLWGFQTELANGRKRIAIFYGAGHMADFEKRLVSDFGLKRDRVEWLPAWNLKL